MVFYKLSYHWKASFVEATAKQYGMDVFLRVWPNDLKRGSNFQDSARVWRKSEALSIINNINNNYGKFISTGHHLDDQLETIVMKLLRGTFIANIRGVSLFYVSIAWLIDAPTQMVNNDGTFIKPLLPFRKYELVSYLQAQSFEWKEDSSNQSRDYKRNKVRLDLMPLLSDIAGGEAALENRLTSLVDQSNQVKSLLESQTRVYGDFLEYHKYGDGYRTLLFKQEPKNIPLLMLHEVIHKWIYSSCGINLSYPILQKVVNLLYILGSRKSVSATISKDWDVCLVGRELRLMKRFQQFFMDSCKSTLDLSGHDVLITHPPFLRFSAEPLDGDYRKISFPFPNDNPKCDVSVRFAREGEKLPSKYGRGQKISTLAINNGVPSSERDRVLLFAHHDQPLLIALPHKVIIASDYLQQPQDNPVGLHWVTFYMKLDRNDSVPTEPSQILHG